MKSRIFFASLLVPVACGSGQSGEDASDGRCSISMRQRHGHVHHGNGDDAIQPIGNVNAGRH